MESCARFLAEMEDYRRLAAAMPADRLLSLVFDRTGFLAMAQAMPNGELRLANLRRLLEYARSFESSGYRGLPALCGLSTGSSSRRPTWPPASVLSESANVVRVMSVHRSKGLEFPFCILAGCARQFNQERARSCSTRSSASASAAGTRETLCRYTTVPREAVSLAIEYGGLSEELRILYVALTRAREQLVMLSTLKNAEKNPRQARGPSDRSAEDRPMWCAAPSPFPIGFSPAPCAIPAAAPCGNWPARHTASLFRRNALGYLDLHPARRRDADGGLPDNRAAEPDEAFLRTIGERFSYVYPYEPLERIPAKGGGLRAFRQTARTGVRRERPAFFSHGAEPHARRARHGGARLYGLPITPGQRTTHRGI